MDLIQCKSIDHFGSTSVPGLVAKPIIDILVGVQRIPMSAAKIRALESLGYEYVGEAGIPGRFYFRKRQEQVFNIAIVEWNGRLWKENLLIRDFLRSHPEYVSKYAELKKAAVSAGITDLLTYPAYKQALMAEILRKARGLRDWHNPRDLGDMC